MKKLALFCFNTRKKITNRLATFLARLHLKWWGVLVGSNLFVRGFLVLIPKGKLIIGNNVTINSAPVSVGGSIRRTAFRVEPEGTLVIKDGVGMSNITVICFDSITFEEGAMIGGGCEFLDGDAHPLAPASRAMKGNRGKTGPIVIGKNTFIGGKSTVLKGVTVGEGAVIGMGSLVTKNIPPYEIWAGVPARFIKKLEM